MNLTTFKKEELQISWDTYPFDIFDTNPSAYKTFLKYLKSVPFEIAALENDCINKLIEKGLSKIKWLDVGAGLGDPVFPVLELLEKRGISVDYHYLEPSKRACEIFRRDIESHLYQKAVFTYNTKTWEDYDSSESFDLITFFHSAYYIKNWSAQLPNSLTKAVDYLNLNGFIYFSNLSEGADYNKVVSSLKKKNAVKKPPITAENIMSLCAYMNLPESVNRNIDLYLEVSRIKDNNYSEYKDVVEFLTDKPFTEELSDLISNFSHSMLFPISTISIGL
jgi:SAM-dependent methyltransferase